MLFRESAIHVGGHAENKTDAIRKVGALLVASGNIEPGYVDSMLEREKVANTFLGNGIAIPHGIPEQRDMIKQTGVAVYQVPGGVEWDKGEIVHLVVGIAAKSDEHLTVLSNLTDVLGDAEEAARLANTESAGDIAQRLSGGNLQATSEPEDVPADFDDNFDITVTNPHGLHARPATTLVDLAKTFQAEIRVRNGNKVGDAKSLIGLLKLGIENGATIKVMAQGTDAIKALAAIQEAFEAGLEDEDEALEDAALSNTTGKAVLNYEGTAIHGISASPGIALGPVKQFHRGKINVTAFGEDTATELKELETAVTAAKSQLAALHQNILNRSGASKAAIFKAQAEFLEDPEILKEAKALIQDGRSAGWAWQQAYEEHADALASMQDAILSARALDLRDVGRRVLKLLADVVEADPELPDSPVILIADDLTPSDTAGLDPELVLGLCTASGGPTSHTAIIARGMDIPAVVSAGDHVQMVADGTHVILDGSGGLLVSQPTDRDKAHAEKALVEYQAQQQAEKLACYQPAITSDGIRIEVAANIGSVDEAGSAVEAGGEGIGLLRTEFQFLERAKAPTEEEQYDACVAMTKKLNGLPMIVRTLDIGGDKEVPYLQMPSEMNPFLGERGIRLCLNREDLFRTQLRAILRASSSGPIRIMYPMIATLEELRAAKAITEEIRLEVGADPVEIGMMIEIPSAVMMAEEFAREVDFFSIGTNDLTQYALAMDRMHPKLAPMADGLHPAVLRLIERTVVAADKAGIWVGACGGIAGDPLGAMILTGLGLKELSVSIPAIATVKAQIRAMSFADAQKLAQKAISCSTAADVRALA